MKNAIGICLIVSSLLQIGCITDEPPTSYSDLIGTWQLTDLQGATYDVVADSANYTYWKDWVYKESLRTNQEEFTFLPGGLYSTRFDTLLAGNDMQAFVFTAGNMNSPDTLNHIVYGIWEEYINSNDDQIIHFDQRLAREDVFMIINRVDRDSLIMKLELNSYNTQNAVAILIPTAEYQGARGAYYLSNLAPDVYNTGYQFGSKVGFYQGFADAYNMDDKNFLWVYGRPFNFFFMREWTKRTRIIPNIEQGFADGFKTGYALGGAEAQREMNGSVKGFALTYKFVRK